jgi:ribosomal protein L11 methyltransferase
MFSLFLKPSPELEDLLVAELWELGTTGIVEEAGGIRAFFDSDSDSAGLLQRFASYLPELREEQPIDWAQATRDAWPAVAVGRRFFLAPPWSDEAAPAGRLRLSIYPGMACGTGRHPATQLALEAIEDHVRRGDAVADIGTGSGILSAAASLVGAGMMIGCDVDPDAVEIARERLSTPLFVGSAGAIRSGWADVVIANIDSPTIEKLAGEFARIRKPRSTLILTGFPEWDLPEGFQSKEVRAREEWRCLIC